MVASTALEAQGMEFLPAEGGKGPGIRGPKQAIKEPAVRRRNRSPKLGEYAAALRTNAAVMAITGPQ